MLLWLEGTLYPAAVPGTHEGMRGDDLKIGAERGRIIISKVGVSAGVPQAFRPFPMVRAWPVSSPA